ncbi:tRNA epoxyqueuosine(34) reductase QueG [Thiotrichales bacterium 19S9-12]|nr:tRNA epoxyqueuosine(34) reductase QueG [Thiotrichales bacterium 19S9-11]MCF6812395.1 tRNA epoxyqueuosine(34) reductase QueG [Thiotrichales bacterium 19S9-12]
MNKNNLAEIWQIIENHAKDLGFSNISVTDCDLSRYIQHYHNWVNQNYHGDMVYMTSHGDKRYHPEKLVEGTQRVIVVTVPYLTKKYDLKEVKKELKQQSDQAAISRYAWGRDYHKVIKKRLELLAKLINEKLEGHQYRVFTDSAPVLEKPLAEKANLGSYGKHSNILTKAGSWFFLGEIYTNIPFKPVNITETEDLCGACTACIKVCPTNAIVAPKIVDARRCISYLTIENKGPIPLEYRKAIGNRIYGCDDCQLICPWNRYATVTPIKNFEVRHQLDSISLLDVFNWDEKTFLKKTEGSAIRRIKYLRWIRNIAIALGNAPHQREIIQALEAKKLIITDEMVLEHIDWAIDQQQPTG